MSENSSSVDYTFNSIGIIGSGQMGAGIAQVLATYGIQVILQDIKASSILFFSDESEELSRAAFAAVAPN